MTPSHTQASAACLQLCRRHGPSAAVCGRPHRLTLRGDQAGTSSTDGGRGSGRHPALITLGIAARRPLLHCAPRPYERFGPTTGPQAGLGNESARFPWPAVSCPSRGGCAAGVFALPVDSFPLGRVAMLPRARQVQAPRERRAPVCAGFRAAHMHPRDVVLRLRQAGSSSRPACPRVTDDRVSSLRGRRGRCRHGRLTAPSLRPCLLGLERNPPQPSQRTVKGLRPCALGTD